MNLEAKQITVKAGTTIKEIITALDFHGLDLSAISAINWQTIVGPSLQELMEQQSIMEALPQWLSP